MSTGILVVPCYNEAGRLDVPRFREFARGNAHWRLLMVNDGSTDATLSMLGTMADAEPGRVLVCDLGKNRGKAEAVRRGILEAVDLGAEYVGFFDADLATPLTEADRFLDVLERRPDIDIVVGTRMPLLGRRIARRMLRSVLGRVFGFTASSVIGVPLYDTQCGAKVFRVTDETVAMFSKPFQSRWIFDVELFARLVAGRRNQSVAPAQDIIYELPLEEWREVPGSKLRSKDFLRAVLELATIYRRYYLSTSWSAETSQNAGTFQFPRPADAQHAAPANDADSNDNQHRRAA